MGTFPNRNLNQTAVYWASPTNDGQGGFTFDSPVEIRCRWVDSSEVREDSKGDEFLSKAEVQVNQDLEEQGMLFLGTLNDLTTAQKTNPATIQRAYFVRDLGKAPTIRGDKFYRKVFLGV